MDFTDRIWQALFSFGLDSYRTLGFRIGLRGIAVPDLVVIRP